MSEPAIAVAAFDFDATLTTGDTVVPFMRRLVPMWRLVAGTAVRAGRSIPALVQRDRDQLRAVASQIVFAGRSVAEVEHEAASFASSVVANRLRDDTVRRLRWHLEAGHHVVIVSASYEEYLRPVAAALDVSHVVGTRLEHSDGRYTGRLDGPNCRGAEKVRRIEAWLADRGLHRADIEVYAYGDSKGDRELLAWSDHPHWVNSPLTSVAPTV